MQLPDEDRGKRTHAKEIDGSNSVMMADASVSDTTSSTESGARLGMVLPRTTAAALKVPSSAPCREARRRAAQAERKTPVVL